MFRGIHLINLDGKGRLAIPAKYRERLIEHCAGQMICTVQRVGCLLLYPLPEWLVVEQELAALPSIDPVSGELQRMMLAYASECELDSQGRILLPQMLRRFARLDKGVVWSGLGRRSELWDEATWEARAEEWRAGVPPSGEGLPPSLARLSL